MNEGNRPTVSVYIPCHNYDQYLAEAIDSVLDQTYDDWELLVIDDGSDDDTARIAETYADSHPDKIQVLRHDEPRGLQSCANRALQEARGKYIVRLDADDWLDENALLVMARYLDTHPDVALVFPNYIYVDPHGEILGIEKRKKIPEEVKLLDLPAHGACTMVRRSTLKTVGGYNEDYDCQDGYELWLKIFPRYEVANVSTPLFYYRQHSDSLSRDEDRLLETRRKIKHDLATEQNGDVEPDVVAVVPAKNTYEDLPNIALREIAGKPLIDYTLEAATEVEAIDHVFVSTDDPDVVRHCESVDGVEAAMRPEDLSHGHNLHYVAVRDAVRRLEGEFDVYPDIVVDLSVHSPLRTAEHIQEAVDTLVLYDADSVVSVCEDREVHFTHGEHGLELVNENMLKRLVVEREALYLDNWAVKAFWRDVLADGDIFGEKVGHIVMTEEESFKIESEFDAWLVSKILKTRRDTKTKPEIPDT